MIPGSMTSALKELAQVFSVVLVTLVYPVTNAHADACAVNKPPIRSIDRTCLPAPGRKVPVPIFKSDVRGPYQEIAYIDSFTAQERCADTVRAQLKDVQSKAEAIGADAVIRLRPLHNKITGLQEDPHTPFFSLRQGYSEDHFYRATAIKYLGNRAQQGQPVITRASASAGGSSLLPTMPGLGDGLDTNSLFKTRVRRDDPINPLYEEDTVPQIYSTQPLGPR